VKKVLVCLLIGEALVLYGCALAEPENARSSLLVGKAKAKVVGKFVENSLELKIVNLRNRTEYATVTDTKGYFFIPNIEPGEYWITKLIGCVQNWLTDLR
jgi:hypothetical protein